MSFLSTLTQIHSQSFKSYFHICFPYCFICLFSISKNNIVKRGYPKIWPILVKKRDEYKTEIICALHVGIYPANVHISSFFDIEEPSSTPPCKLFLRPKHWLRLLLCAAHNGNCYRLLLGLDEISHGQMPGEVEIKKADWTGSTTEFKNTKNKYSTVTSVQTFLLYPFLSPPPLPSQWCLPILA